MSSSISRRNFITGLGAVSVTSVLPVGALGAGIQVGYAAITWGGNDLQAIKDISEVGFRGIQLRSPILRDFGDKPQALRDLLKQYRLEFVALSGGGPGPNSGTDQDVITTQVKHAEFMRATGGRYLQMTDSSRPKDRKPVADELKKLGQLLTEVGKRTSDLGIPVAYHNHMNSLGEAPDEVDAIMDAADPRYVKLLLDVAHYQQGGGDPVKAITQYRDRILFLHIKDVESPVPGATGDLSRSYRFVELGRGKVNLPDVFAALKKIKFSGWAIVELDRVPDPAVTPKEAAIVCKKYLEEKLKMKI